MDAAFTSGSGVAPAGLLLGIAMIVMTLFTLWTAWVAYAQFQLWQTGQGDLYGFLSTILRASLLLLVLGFFIR